MYDPTLGTLMFGTVDSWLLYKITGIHVTDVTNASRTLLLDLHKRKWSTELCRFFDIPLEILPAGSLQNVPISGCLGDQQSALVGHNCLRAGEAKNTYGTGTFMLCNTGNRPILSKNGLLTTVGYQFGPNAPEGSGSIGGNVVRFLRDNFASDIEMLASSVETSNDVVFVPCFSGLFTPYWDATARGIICGLTQCATRAHIALATTEMIDAVEHDLGESTKVRILKIDGGMTANHLFNQIQADILGRAIICSKMTEISGAAIAAGIGCEEVLLEQLDNHPKMVLYNSKSNEEEREKEMQRWKEAVKRARNWTN